METEITTNENLVAYCGLYCGACKRYLAWKCNGCGKNEKATWCSVRSCCMQDWKWSCADCQIFSEINDCKMFNNFFSKLFWFIFSSDRKACIKRIKEIGKLEFAKEMAEKKTHTIKKK